MISAIDPAAVRRSFLLREEVALIDLREEAPFALSHPLFASQMSAGRIEIEAMVRIPRKDALIVLYDDGEGLVDVAAVRFKGLGYSNVCRMAGGLKGWADAGYELFQDVNSYSKAFGELVEHRRRTPSLPAQQVRKLIEDGADIRILDARRYDEFHTMSIPAGASAPGAELVLRAGAVASDPTTTIIVNCAGRTRSIIGAQSLINAGLPNPVFALRNGTIGWTLAGQELATGQTRSAPFPEGSDLQNARERSREVAYRAGVRGIRIEDLLRLEQSGDRTHYRFDVRGPAEYLAGHPPGFRNAPGGQLVQETDMFAPVRGARIVLWDDIGPRAHMTASWLAQMGWEVYVLDQGSTGQQETGEEPRCLPPLPDIDGVDADELERLLRSGKVAAIDLAPSKVHAAGHVPGARFALRVELPRILRELPSGAVPVLIDPDGALSCFAAADLPRGAVKVLRGGAAAWLASGRSLASGLEKPLSEPSDRYKRPYEGTDNAAEAMQAYLDWEFGLVEQLRRDGTHGFVVI